MQSNASNYMSAPARKTSRRVRDPARFASDNHAAPRFAPVAAVQGIEYDPTSDRAPRIDDEDVWAGLIISSFFRPVDGVESDDDMHPRTPNERQEYISDCQRMLSSVLPPEPEGPLVHKPPEWSKQTYAAKVPEKPRLSEGPSPRSPATRYTKPQEVPVLLPGSDNSTSTDGWAAGSISSWAASNADTVEDQTQAETESPPACCEIQAQTDASAPSWPGGYAQAY